MRHRKILNYSRVKPNPRFALILSIFLLNGICASSQENPWTYKRTENPWVTTTVETKSQELEETSADTIAVALQSDSTFFKNGNKGLEENKTHSEQPQSMTSLAQSVQARKINLYEIEGRAKDEYNAGLALGCSIPAIIFPPITVPILIASVFIPTAQQKMMIEQYKIDNPSATEVEVKAVKRGIRKKRAKRTAGGAGIGLGIAAVILSVAIFN
jgi:hypothetical protein